jgi:hypothetical protein
MRLLKSLPDAQFFLAYFSNLFTNSDSSKNDF